MKVGVAIGALVIAAGLASGASAQVTTNTYGSGNTLFAPYLRQAEDCYGNPTALVIQGANTHSPTTRTITPFDYTGTPPFNCATTHVDASLQLNTIQTGSGTGIKAVYSHDPVTFWGDTVPPGEQQHALSDRQLGDVGDSARRRRRDDLQQRRVEQGVTFTASPGAGQYPIPQPLYGNLIQYPMLIAPLALAYDSVYKKVRNADGSITSYHFNIAKRARRRQRRPDPGRAHLLRHLQWPDHRLEPDPHLVE